MNLIDCHNHSSYSFDGEFSVVDMVNTAKKKGLCAFAITDHCELNEFSQRNHPKPIADCINEINLLKQQSEFKDIELIAGVEIGQPLFDVGLAKQITDLAGLDFIIGSLHCVNGGADYYYINFNLMNNHEVFTLNEKYFIEMKSIANNADFDILGHITYPFRYMRKAMDINHSLNFSFDCYDELIYEVLKAVVANNKGIEINTSTLHSIGETLPSEKYVKMYKQLGGEQISIGSDAHVLDAVGRGIEQGHQIAIDAGFKYATYYKNRKPVMIKIV